MLSHGYQNGVAVLPLMSCHVCSLLPIQRVMVDVQVVMTFSMQGVGNFTNTAVLCILLVIYGSAEANKRTHKYTGWRYPSPPCLLAALLGLASMCSMPSAALAVVHVLIVCC